MAKSPNLQDVFLASARRTEIPVTVFMVNGFDTFTVVLTTEGRQNLIYKHAISTVSPARGVDLSEWEDTL